jgi:hypothetical protein
MLVALRGEATFLIGKADKKILINTVSQLLLFELVVPFKAAVLEFNRSQGVPSTFLGGGGSERSGDEIWGGGGCMTGSRS